MVVPSKTPQTIPILTAFLFINSLLSSNTSSRSTEIHFLSKTNRRNQFSGALSSALHAFTLSQIMNHFVMLFSEKPSKIQGIIRQISQIAIYHLHYTPKRHKVQYLNIFRAKFHQKKLQQNQTVLKKAGTHPAFFVTIKEILCAYLTPARRPAPWRGAGLRGHDCPSSPRLSACRPRV